MKGGDNMKRRSYMKTAIALVLVVIMAGTLVGMTFAAAGCTKKAATGDFSVTSSTDSGHSHAATVLGKDVDTPPAQAVYTSTVVGGHSHQITLTKANLDAIRNGQSVSVVSTPAGSNGHTHTWVIKKP
jgi:hypothetical protein